MEKTNKRLQPAHEIGTRINHKDKTQCVWNTACISTTANMVAMRYISWTQNCYFGLRNKLLTQLRQQEH